jgi:CheY-like chemotaxis protein/anti-sigma regulatory factor (Ser/Thr protein kinase)
MMNEGVKSILVVDDDINNVEILKMDLEGGGYDILTACNGVEGWEVLQENKENICAILLDRMMPEMNGMEFMTKLKADESVAQKPVIMQTAAAEKSQVTEGIKAGVYYYLTKPYDVDVMQSIVFSAIGDYTDYNHLRSELLQHKNKVHLVKESNFEIRTLGDARYLSTFLANFYPDSQRALLGISEMLINAIEHGNLGITYADKTRLQSENRWEEEIEALQLLQENEHKKVVVHFVRGEDHIALTVTDDGDGFDWQQYMEIDPARATHSHGRGIALSNLMSFDSIEYRGSGNEVVCRFDT